MRLTRPMQITFAISLIVAVLAFLIAAGVISNPINSLAVVWIALIAYLILALGVLIRDM